MSEQVKIGKELYVDMDELVQEMIEFSEWAAAKTEYMELMEEEIYYDKIGEDEISQEKHEKMYQYVLQYRKDKGLHFLKNHYFVMASNIIIRSLCNKI